MHNPKVYHKLVLQPLTFFSSIGDGAKKWPVILSTGLTRKPFCKASAKHRLPSMRDNTFNTGGAKMNLKVLAIDDDHAMTELLTLLLKTHGFNVMTANTGEDGVSIALKESPDVIILDLMMPGMDGWQVCNQIRKFSSVPILVFSALDSPGMVASALDAGADDYLVKPVPSGVLIAHLNKLTRRTGMNNGDKYKPQTAPISI